MEGTSLLTSTCNQASPLLEEHHRGQHRHTLKSLTQPEAALLPHPFGQAAASMQFPN